MCLKGKTVRIARCMSFQRCACVRCVSFLVRKPEPFAFSLPVFTSGHLEFERLFGSPVARFCGVFFKRRPLFAPCVVSPDASHPCRSCVASAQHHTRVAPVSQLYRVCAASHLCRTVSRPRHTASRSRRITPVSQLCGVALHCVVSVPHPRHTASPSRRITPASQLSSESFLLILRWWGAWVNWRDTLTLPTML